MGGAAGGHCCSQELSLDGPFVIKTAPSRYFKKKTPMDKDAGWESENDEEEPDMFEHFMLGATGSRALAAKQKKVPATDQEHRSVKVRIAPGFDHETTFFEEEEEEEEGAKPRRNKSRRPSGHVTYEEGSLLLINSLKRGDAAQTAELLRQRPDCINEKDHFGQTALFFATASGDLELVQALLDCKAEAGCMNQHGYTPLMRALCHGFVAVSEELVRFSADINAKDCQGSSALHLVAASGQVGAVEWLLGTVDGAKQIHLRNRDGHTALLKAVRHGHAAVCHRLLDAGAGADSADDQGRTPVLYALAANDLELALRLIGSRADVNAEDEEGRSVLTALVINVIRHPEQRQVSVCGVSAALEARANVEAVDQNGLTPLLVCALSNEAMLCAILMAYSADASATDSKERTPFVAARTKGYTDVCKVLNEVGDTRTVANKYLDRLLLRAVYYGSTTTCKALLDRGADGGQLTKDGLALREVARRLGHTGVVKVMKDAKQVSRPASSSPQDAERSRATLQVWLQELREGSRHAGELQRCCRAKDADAVLSVVGKLTRARPSPGKGSFSAELIATFVRERVAVTLRHVQQDLRGIRVATRQGLLAGFAEDLLEWDRGGQGDEHELQRIMALGVNNVRGVQISEFEAKDSYTVELEERQAKCIDPVLRLAYEIPSIYADEINSHKMFPSDEALRHIQHLQCPKCMLSYGNSKAYSEHVKYCQSKVGENEEEGLRQKRVSKAESAINILESAAHRYRKKAMICQSLAQEVMKQRGEHLKSYPEAMPVLVACSTFVEIVETICWHREETCMQAASQQSKKWGLANAEGCEGDDDTSSMVCRSCLAKPTSRIAQHRDGTRPCAVLCSACAFELGMKLKAGKDVLCPGCGKPMNGTAVQASTGRKAC